MISTRIFPGRSRFVRAVRPRGIRYGAGFGFCPPEATEWYDNRSGIWL
jgi:hypothetical protein